MNPDLEDGGGAPQGQAVLDPFEIRVLGVLAEKEMLTPENYPLSLNAVVNGCNQLSSREPVMALGEETVLEVLQRLVQKKLAAEVTQAGARVTKYEHRMRIKWTLQQDKLTVLTLLMLRGVQTAGEIRTRCGRMQEFASIAEVEAALQFLIDKFPPLVARLARAPGTKEPRYMHLLAGEESVQRLESASAFASAPASDARVDRLAQLEQEVARLRSDLDEMARQFESFRRQFE